MCFSAAASFGAGAALAVAGVATIRKAKEPSQVMFACIPLFFAIQQISEGFVWLSLLDTAYEPGRVPGTYTFLTFAQVIWPAWVPVSVFMLEQNPVRRNVLLVVAVLGVITGIGLAVRLATTHVLAAIIGCHVTYDIASPPWLVILISVLYFVTVIPPLFLSTRKHMKVLAAVLLLSLIMARIFYEVQFLSVWCFFSAILSVVVYFMLRSFNPEIVKQKHVQAMEH